jgi:hypothetical protein
MLKLRTIGIRDYVVLEGKQRIGWIRLATERMTCVWLWRCCHPSDRRTPDGLIQGHRHGQGGVAWQALKARTTPEQLAAAYKSMNTSGTTTDSHSARRMRTGRWAGVWNGPRKSSGVFAKLRAAGKSIVEIAELLKRTEASVSNRIFLSTGNQFVAPLGAYDRR